MPETPDPSATLVRQPHGGALKRGGQGKGANVARPPSRLQALLRRDLAKTRKVLLQIARGVDGRGKEVETSNADKIRAIALMAQYGLTGAEVSLADVKTALEATRSVLVDSLPPDVAEALWSHIIPIWLAL